MKPTYNLYLFAPFRPAANRWPRGKRIASFATWKELKADAERRAVAAGYPKSRWMELFDWAQS